MFIDNSQNANLRSDGKDEANNEAVETKSLSEDEHEDHADEELLLLGVGADTSVTDDTNAHTGSEGRETSGETGSKVREATVSGVALGGN